MTETYEIVRSGRVISLEPFPDKLRRELTFSITEMTHDKRGKLTPSTKKKSMYSQNPDNPNQYFIPAGFTHTVHTFLTDMGVPSENIHFEDIRNLSIEKPRLDLLDNLRDWQIDALSRILSSSMGVIWTTTASGKSYLIKQLVKALPNTKIVITGHDSQPLKDIYNDLKRQLGTHAIGGLGVIGRGGDQGRRVTVCHIRSLLSAPIETAEILIYDEVHGAASPERSAHLAKVSFANMYGFSASAVGRLDKKEPIIHGLFGPIIYRMKYTEARDEGLVADITVHLYEVRAVQKNYDTYQERILHGYVQHEERNRVIAAVAKKYADKSQIIYTIDNLEHVFRLHSRLPEWTPVYGSGSFTQKRQKTLKRKGLLADDYTPLYKGEEYVMAERFREGEISKAIATSVWGEGVDFPELEVVIRADGRPGKIEAIQIPGRAARKTDGKNEGIIVDFIDNYGRTFKNRSDQRIRHYKSLGFKVERKVL